MLDICNETVVSCASRGYGFSCFHRRFQRVAFDGNVLSEGRYKIKEYDRPQTGKASTPAHGNVCPHNIRLVQASRRCWQFICDTSYDTESIIRAPTKGLLFMALRRRFYSMQ